MSPTPQVGLRRIGHSVRAHPRRSGIVAAVLALVLAGAALTFVQPGGSGPKEPPSGGAGPAGSAAGEEAGQADGGPGVTEGPGGTVAPGAGSGSTGTDGRPGTAAPTSGPAGEQPLPASRVPGSPPEPGAEPVASRPPVRCPSTGSPQAAPLPSADERDGQRWVTVGRLAGNCDAASQAFRLLGIDTRLVWRSDADSFAVFVVDDVRGREATAGFADGECAGSCSESLPIVPAAGSYRLEVQAGDAPWEVEVQEYRRA